MINMFNKTSNAIYQLEKDKHTLLEGYVTEFLFQQQFLSLDSLHTHGWWMGLINNKRMFFVIKDKLNDLDRDLIQSIPHFDQCWQVILKERTLYFANREEILDEGGFVLKNNLKPIRDKLKASDDTRNTIRQQKCIDFFVNHGLIKDIATERYFVNNFLTVYFGGMINIDYFTKDKKGNINVIEVKFKYESRDNCFGINTGQMKMFDYFKGLGFKINHFILYNHTRNMNTSIFGFLDLPEEKYWLFTGINTDNNIMAVAPERTSISGSFQQSYYKINKSDIKTHIPFKVNV